MKNNISSVQKTVAILMLAILLSSTACSLNVEVEDNNVSSSISSESVSDESVSNPFYENVFVKIADKIDTISYEECLDYVNSTGYPVTVTDPTNEEGYEIDVENTDGFHIHLFTELEDGKRSIYLISYSNNIYEVSVIHDHTANKYEYHIYDSTREEKRKTVNSLEDLTSFVKNELPNKLKEYSDSNTTKEIIDVSFDVSCRTDDGKAFFDIKSNLPENMELNLSLEKDDYYSQSSVVLNSGFATSKGFSDKGNPLQNGKYKLSISSKYPNLQDNTVTSVIGLNGEFLTGKYIYEKNGYNMILAEFEFDI